MAIPLKTILILINNFRKINVRSSKTKKQKKTKQTEPFTFDTASMNFTPLKEIDSMIVGILLITADDF